MLQMLHVQAQVKKKDCFYATTSTFTIVHPETLRCHTSAIFRAATRKNSSEISQVNFVKSPPPLPTRGTSFKTDGNETRGAQRLREILFFFFLLRGETGGKLVSRNER